jgi:hypothetical protein
MKSENTGFVEISPGIPYEPQDLASLFEIDLKTVQFGIQLFSSEKFNMIRISEMNSIEVCNFLKHQRVEQIQKVREQTRLRVEKHRQSRKLLVSDCKTENGNALLTQVKQESNATHIHSTDTSTDTSTITDTIQGQKEEKDKDSGAEKIAPTCSPCKTFQIPTIEEIKNYCIERKNTVDFEKFFAHYESNGWMVGRNKMKDWKAAIRYWERTDQGNPLGRKMTSGERAMETVRRGMEKYGDRK